MLDLDKFIGEEIKITMCRRIGLLKRNYVLEEYKYSDYIIADGFKIPFVGENVAIGEIYDKDDNLLYINPFIDRSYNVNSMEDVYDLQRKMFGSTQEKNIDNNLCFFSKFATF